MDDRDEDFDPPGVVEVVGNETDISAEPSVRKGCGDCFRFRSFLRKAFFFCGDGPFMSPVWVFRKFGMSGVCFEDIYIRRPFVSPVGFPLIV